jgi:hypothetical protein
LVGCLVGWLVIYLDSWLVSLFVGILVWWVAGWFIDLLLSMSVNPFVLFVCDETTNKCLYLQQQLTMHFA